MKKTSNTIAIIAVMCGILTLSSCAIPGYMSNSNNCFPQSVTETHTKTTLVAPPSYSMPYLPPSAIYQSAPQQMPMPMQAPICQQPYQSPVCPPPQIYQSSPVCPQNQIYQASPVCPPSPNYQAQQYSSDPCNTYPNQPTIRYNAVGTANHVQPQYIVVHPEPISQQMPLQLQNSACPDSRSEKF